MPVISDSPELWTPPVELRALARRDGINLLQELVEEFRTDTASRMQGICRSLSGGNLIRARQEAHAVKGSAIQMGAASLVVLSSRLEMAAATGDRAEAVSLLETLESEFARVAHSMSAHCLSLAGDDPPPSPLSVA